MGNALGLGGLNMNGVVPSGILTMVGIFFGGHHRELNPRQMGIILSFSGDKPRT